MTSLIARPLIVGEMPGPDENPDFPLSPFYEANGISRLIKHMDVTNTQYSRMFDKSNIFYERSEWDHATAEAHAALLIDVGVSCPEIEYDFFLLGRRVAKAFGVFDQQFYVGKRVDNLNLFVIPEPTEGNIWYTDPSHIQQAKMFWMGYKYIVRRRLENLKKRVN